MELQEWLGEDNQLGIDIWHKKYQHNNETFDEWLDRISNGNSTIRQLIIEKKFLFGGRILANRGLENEGKKITLSNCYVVDPPADNIESIFECAKQLARTYSYGGGCGVDLSKLAPNGAHVNNAAETTSGATSFMDLYSLVTELIGQCGRRGALMISMDCHHPDIEKFITIKSDLNKVTKANISIRVTDDFMTAVENNSNFTLSFTRPENNETISKLVNAKDLFLLMCKMNWNYAEPGILFWDRIEKWNLVSEFKEFQYAGVNPCAEEPLSAGSSCLLGSINLSEFVTNPFTKDAQFDLDTFDNTVMEAVIGLNEVLDEGVPLHPLEEQRNSVRDWRSIGLGVMGIADMLIKLGMKYGSEESLDLCNIIAGNMAFFALSSSALLAKENGSFPKFNYEELIQSPYYKLIISMSPKDSPVSDTIKEYGLRNNQLLCAAPTGTLSTMLGISGGIEPIFANKYQRKTQSLHGEDVYYDVYTPICKKYMEINNSDTLPEYFIESHNIPFINRIKMQAVWQRFIDASISSTINLPNEATVDDIAEIYMQAWKKGLKGVTVYRDGCARGAVLTEKKEDNKLPSEEKLPWGTIIEADDNVIGLKRKLITGCGSLHCTAFFDPVSGELVETYFSKGSSGGCQQFMVGLSRTISLLARAGVDINTIVDQLNSCGTCPSYAVRTATKHDTSKGACCPMAIGNALLDMYKEMQDKLFLNEEDDNSEEEIESVAPNTKPTQTKKALCPECGEPLVFEGGCNTCKNCGWSKCN